MNPNQPPTNPMPPQSQSQPPSNGSDIQKLIVLQPGEQVICDIKRHPFGLFSIYISSGILAVVALVAAAAVPTFLNSVSQQVKMATVLGALIFLAFVLLYTFIATTVYNANRWIVTSDSITQITQVGLFNKETSQLSMANLEDVTVDQNGLLQSMIGFGTLRAESAGARGKFQFPFCPKPNEFARKVIEAHEAYIANKPEETITANRPLATTTSFNQTWQPPAGTQPPANGPQG